MTYYVAVFVALLWWSSLRAAYAKGRRDQMLKVVAMQQHDHEVEIAHVAARADASAAAWRGQ